MRCLSVSPLRRAFAVALLASSLAAEKLNHVEEANSVDLHAARGVSEKADVAKSQVVGVEVGPQGGTRQVWEDVLGGGGDGRPLARDASLLQTRYSAAQGRQPVFEASEAVHEAFSSPPGSHAAARGRLNSSSPTTSRPAAEAKTMAGMQHGPPETVGLLPRFSKMLKMTVDVLCRAAARDIDPFPLPPARTDGDSLADFNVDLWGPKPGAPVAGPVTGPALKASNSAIDPELAGSGDLKPGWQDGGDVLAGPGQAHPPNGDEGFDFFKAAPMHEWMILGLTCVALCFLDLAAFRRLPDTFHAHLGAIGIWLMVAVLFNMLVWTRMGELKAFQWCSGYVLEWMLSMDNIFVFHLIFQTYQTPMNQIHKAVFVGVIGAVVMRMVFFMVVSSLLHLAHWIRFPFGLLLIWSGIESARDGDDDQDVKDTWLIQSLKSCLGDRLEERYVEGDPAGWGGKGALFVVGEDGRVKATLLLIVVACLELTDIIFALDSVSAKVAQIPDQYIAFSSSVLAMYGLRASFFIMQDLVVMFDLLKYGLCIILVFIGFELMLSQYIHLAASTVCIMILSVFVTCISGSLARRHYISRSCAAGNPSEGPGLADGNPPADAK